jgi:hypothetical protein
LGRFGWFRYCKKLDAKLAEQAPLMHKFAKWSCVGTCRNERNRSTPLDRKLMFWGISDRFVTPWKSMQNWLNRCHLRTSSLNKVVSEFFGTNAPDPIHWTQNSCFGRFGLFYDCTKVDAKLAELAPLTPKFAKRSCVGTFHNERTGSTALYPKFMFRGVSDCFLTVWKSMKNFRTSTINAQVC